MGRRFYRIVWLADQQDAPYGLLSSPIPWLHLQNDLMGDPELRQHYQIWHFIYPPGLPVAFSARVFRDKLEELYHFLTTSR